MKKIISVVLAAMLTLSLAVSSYAMIMGSTNTTNNQSPVIEIIATNDSHCEYTGFAKVATLAKNADLLLDNGDAIQGGSIGTLSKGVYILEIMNKLGYDAMSLGNHEFDYTIPTLLDYAKNLAEFPMLSCNAIDLRTGKNIVEPYKIFEVKGKTIGVLGISTPETYSSSTPSFFKDENGEYIYGFFGDETGTALYNQVQKNIDELKSKGCDVIIALAHLGTVENLSPWTSYETIANISGIDVLVDGHSHDVISTTYKDKTGKQIPCIQTGTKLENAARITINEDKINVELVSLENVEEDADAKALVDSYTSKLETLTAEVIGNTSFDLTINDENGKRLIRSGETNLGDFVTDAYKTVLGADICLLNGGAIRTTISSGQITYGDILNLHPFGNDSCLIEASGAQIADALEYSVSSLPGEFGGFLQTSGLTYTVNLAIRSTVVTNENSEFVKVAGQRRVSNIKINGEDLDLNRTYKVAGIAYLLINNGNGYTMFGKNSKVILNSAKLDSQIIIDYLKENLAGTVPEKYRQSEGRATVINDPSKIESTYYTVVKGDCLWNIAKAVYGKGSMYTLIYEANKDIIQNPRLIYVNQKLLIPAA